MKHLSAYINCLMPTQTHLGRADTGMSTKLAPAGVTCIPPCHTASTEDPAMTAFALPLPY